MIRQMNLSNRQDLAQLRQLVNDALLSIKINYGVELKAGNCTYSGETASFRLNAAMLRSDGSVASKEEEAYKLHHASYGLKLEWLGKTFDTPNGQTFKVVGLNPKGQLYPVIVERDGRRYKQKEWIVKAGFGEKVVPTSY